MKSLILSCLLLFGLTTIIFGKPINDIYSLKDPVITEVTSDNDFIINTYEIIFDSVIDSNGVLSEDKAEAMDIPVVTGVNDDKNLSRMKMKTMKVTPAGDESINAENLFYEKLSERLTEEYRKDSGTEDLPAAFDNSFCCYEFNVPRSVAILINANGKETARK